VTIELKDGDYGDLDRIVNGEIVDPGGVGVTASSSPPAPTPPAPTPPIFSSGGGGGGGCFIDSAGPGALNHSNHLLQLLFLAALCLGIGIVVRLRRRRL
jgi:hypothetical protein